MQTLNPATGNPLKSYACMTESEMASTLTRAHQAFLAWRTQTFESRAAYFLKLAHLLREKKAFFSQSIAQEMGKPIAQGVLEIEKCAWACEHYAAESAAYLAARTIKTEMRSTVVCYEPLGCILAIMPWNYPFWQVFRSAVPILMGGNTYVLKHAPIVTECAVIMQALFVGAGFPEDVFQYLILDDKTVASAIADPHVAGVTFTGSERTGREVAKTSGMYLKPCVLELGGNDPYLVFEDADLDLAARCIVSSRLNNAGQVCIAAKRILAMSSIYESLIEKILILVKGYEMGDPMSVETRLGPMARLDLRETLHAQVRKSIVFGARCEAGGEIPKGPGFFYPPTLLRDIKPGMPAFDDELFGPVIAVGSFDTEAALVKAANQSRYGLSAAIFTADEARGRQVAHQLEVGTCFINAWVSSDPRVPFGGVKQSGFGRELSQEGIRAFMNVKTIGM